MVPKDAVLPGAGHGRRLGEGYQHVLPKPVQHWNATAKHKTLKVCEAVQHQWEVRMGLIWSCVRFVWNVIN